MNLTPRRKALLIGVNEYEDYPELRSPKNGAKALAAYLLDPKKGCFDTVQVAEKTSGNHLKKQIRIFLKSSRSEDQLLLFLSGHGVTGAVEDAYFFGGEDLDPDDPTIGGIPREWLFETIEQAGARHLLLIVDSCYSGRLLRKRNFGDSQNVEILTATDSYNFGFEPEEEGELTYFTQALFDVLTGETVVPNNPPKLTARSIAKTLAGMAGEMAIANMKPCYADSGDAANFWLGLNLHYTEEALAAKAERADPEQEQNYQHVQSAYLKWLLEEHGYLKLYGIHSATNVRGVALENVYVALRGERSSSYEKLKSRNLTINQRQQQPHEGPEEIDEKYYTDGLDSLLSNPVGTYLAHTEKKESFEGQDIPITLGEAFRDERFLVILGDPGSGKTTLSKWLTVQLAREYLKVLQTGAPANVRVLEDKIDPYLDLGKNYYDLGPSRMVILLSIADYAQVYAERHKEGKIALIDYLGNHKWRGQSPTKSDGTKLSPVALRACFIRALKANNAVVILDGMDEVTSYRTEIVAEIETFIEKWIVGQRKSTAYPGGASNLPPHRVGGNQVVITSRIVGYHLSPIIRPVTHVTVEPMKRRAIGRFCQMWMAELFRVKYAKDLPPDILHSQAKAVADDLQQVIFADKRILELATNPLLITIIALVYRKNDSQLPPQRAALYKEALITLIETWKHSSLSSDEVEYVLSEVAKTIHIKYPKGIIREDEMQSLIEKSLAAFRSGGEASLPSSFTSEVVKPFIEEIRNKVGIIAPRGDKYYGFIHLTFQEYLAARFITRDKYKTAGSIVQYLDNPRWKVPLLMALGHISVDPEWSEKLVSDVLLALLDANTKLSNYFPRSALLLSDAFAEMSLDKVEDRIIERVVYELIRFSAQKELTAYYPELTERVNTGLRQIRNSSKGALVDIVFGRILSAGERADNQLVLATVGVMLDNRWFPSRLVRSLYDCLHLDREEWGWVVQRTLLELASDTLKLPEPEEPSLPDTPQVQFEKELEVIRLELQLLGEGKLKEQLLEKVNRIKKLSVVSEHKAQLSQHALAEIKLKTAIEGRSEILEMLLDGTMAEVIQAYKKRLQQKLSTLRPQVAKDRQNIKFYTPLYELFSNVLNNVNNNLSQLTDALNAQINIGKEQLRILEHQQIALRFSFSQLIDTEELVKFDKKVSALDYDQRTFLQVPEDLKIEEEIIKVYYLCNILSSNQELIVSLAEFHTEFVAAHNQRKLAIAKLEKRIQRIEAGTERETMLASIVEKRETIRKQSYSTATYRQELVKYNWAYTNYERNLERYQGQELLPFAEYQLVSTEPSAAELSFRKLLLFASFKGGYPTWLQIEAKREYEKTASFLQQPNVRREAIIESSPDLFYSKYAYDDVIYNAAVSLDVNKIVLDDLRVVTIDKELKNQPRFSTAVQYFRSKFYERINDPSITTGLLQHLLHNTTTENDRVDALLYQVLTASSVQEATTLLASVGEDAPALVRRCKAIITTLHEPIYTAHRKLFYHLKVAFETFSDAHTFESYRKLSGTLLNAYGSALKVPDILTPTYQPVRLVEQYYQSSTANSDDVVYNYAVMLDTLTGANEVENMYKGLLQLSTAPFAEQQRSRYAEQDWPCPPFFTFAAYRTDGLPHDLLSVIEAYRLFEDVRFDLNQAFKETILYRLVVRYILHGAEHRKQFIPPDHHPQIPEMYLFCLQNGLFGNELGYLLPRGFRSKEFIYNKLPGIIQAIPDLYYKCRAALRYMTYVTDRTSYFATILTQIDQLVRPRERCELWRIALSSGYGIQVEEIITKIKQDLVRIENPLARIKNVVDLYELLRDEHEEWCNHILISTIPLIQDDYRRGVTIRTIFNIQLSSELDQQLQQLLDQDEAAYIFGYDLFGLYSLLDNTIFQDQKKGDPKTWVPALLATGLQDIVSFFSRTSVQGEADIAWLRLQQSPNAASVDQLIREGSRSGLELTPNTFGILNQLILDGQSALIRPLLPYLKVLNSAALTAIAPWLQAEDAYLRHCAAVYNAEYHKEVKSDNIDGILAMSLADDTQLYCRANLVLSQGITMVKRNFPLHYTLSELGFNLLKKAVLRLAQERVEGLQHSSIIHFFFNIRIDDIALLWKLLEDEDTVILFKYCSVMNARTLNEFCESLRTGPTLSTRQLNAVVSIAIQNCSEHNTNEIDLYVELQEILVEQYAEQLAGYTFLPNYLTSIIAAIDQVAEKDNPTQHFGAALDEISDNVLAVFSTPFDDIVDRLHNGLWQAFGYFYTKNLYFRLAEEAVLIQEAYSEPRYRLALRLLLFELQKASPHRDLLDRTLDYLVTLVAVWSSDRNNGILNTFDLEHGLYDALIRKYRVIVTAKEACLRLLSHFNRHSSAGFDLLLNQLNSVARVQLASIETLTKIKHLDDELLDRMINGLLEQQPLVGRMYVAILANHANNSATSPANRKRIYTCLIDSMGDKRSQRGVYQFSHANGSIDAPIRMEYVGRLDEFIFKAIVKIVDI
ncbi:MAG: caspase family protein [Bacteroidota bacterium]